MFTIWASWLIVESNRNIYGAFYVIDRYVVVQLKHWAPKLIRWVKRYRPVSRRPPQRQSEYGSLTHHRSG